MGNSSGTGSNVPKRLRKINLTYEKFLNQNSITRIIKKFKKEKKKIVLCHGVFDLVHLGHLKHFKEAKSKGDILIVSVTSDKYVSKGPGRPLFNEKKNRVFELY